MCLLIYWSVKYFLQFHITGLYWYPISNIFLFILLSRLKADKKELYFCVGVQGTAQQITINLKMWNLNFLNNRHNKNDTFSTVYMIYSGEMFRNIGYAKYMIIYYHFMQEIYFFFFFMGFRLWSDNLTRKIKVSVY